MNKYLQVKQFYFNDILQDFDQEMKEKSVTIRACLFIWDVL